MSNENQNPQEGQEPQGVNGNKPAETPQAANGNNPPAEGETGTIPKNDAIAEAEKAQKLKEEQKPQEVEQYKVVRNFVGNDEGKALAKAVEKSGIPGKLLEAHHTDKCFVWQKRQD